MLNTESESAGKTKLTVQLNSLTIMALIKPNERLNQAIRQKKFSQILNFSFQVGDS